MKILIFIILAVVVTPLVFSYFQNKKYEESLKPALEVEVKQLIQSSEVQDATFSMDKLDVSVSGIVKNKETIESLKTAIDDLGDGAVRVSATGYKLQVVGESTVAKRGDQFTLSGTMSSPQVVLDVLNTKLGAVEGLSSIEKSTDIEVADYYKDSTILQNEQLAEWTASYLQLRGDRGYKLSAADDVVRPFGDVTSRLKKKFTTLAAEQGLEINASGFTLVDASPAELEISSVGGRKSLIGRVSVDFSGSDLFPSAKTSLKHDEFIEMHPSVGSSKFNSWVKSYFSAKGERGLKISDNQVSLSGPGTASLRGQWLQELKAQGLDAVSHLDIYPSEYHYPNYVLESQLDDDARKLLLDAFALNQIFFDSGASDVREDQLVKVDALEAAITTVGENVKFVIGGHADSTGNAEFNRELSKKRAASVVAALVQKGIAEDRFTVVSFGAAKAESSGSSESDRKVEIRIK